MPLIRYFLYMGGVLLALLLLLGLYTGEPVSEIAQGGAEPAVARIQSTQKWPEKIVFDTAAPRVSAPDVAAAALAAPAPAEPAVVQNAARQAYAMAAAAPVAGKPAMSAASNRRSAERHYRRPPQRVAARAQTMFFNYPFRMGMGW